MNAKLHTVLDWIRHNLSDLVWAVLLMLGHRLRARLRRSAVESFQVQETINKEGTQMTKAYDVKDLVQRFEKLGLPMAETAAKGVLHETVQWLSESAVLSENKLDDVAALGLPQVEAFIAKYADKIDGVSGN